MRGSTTVALARVFSRLAMVCVLALPWMAGCQSVGVGAGVAGGEWYRYRSDHFEVYSRLPQPVVAANLRDLEGFRALAHRVLDVNDQPSFEHATTMLLLGSQQEIGALFDTRRGIAGFMQPGLRGNLMVAVNGDSPWLNSNQSAFHEYVHYLVHNAGSFWYPMWFDEGLAQLLETACIDGDAFVVGLPPVSAAYILRSDRRMPVERLVNTTHLDGLSPRAVNRFYGTSWLLVHYLFLSADGVDLALRDKTRRYLIAANAGQRDSFAATFGSIEAMETALDGYERGAPYGRISLQDITFSTSFERERVAPDQMAYELASMVVPGNPDYARSLFSSILKRDPQNSRALAGLGVSFQFEEDFDRAEPLIRQALALDDQDWLVLTDLADLLIDDCRHASGDQSCSKPEVVEEAGELYRRAHALNPKSPETLSNYGLALANAGEPLKALPLLQQAYLLAPSNYEIVLGLGGAYAQAGHWPAARQLLSRLAGWTVDNPEERARVARMIERLEVAAGVQEAGSLSASD